MGDLILSILMSLSVMAQSSGGDVCRARDDIRTYTEEPPVDCVITLSQDRSIGFIPSVYAPSVSVCGGPEATDRYYRAALDQCRTQTPVQNAYRELAGLERLIDRWQWRNRQRPESDTWPAVMFRRFSTIRYNFHASENRLTRSYIPTSLSETRAHELRRRADRICNAATVGRMLEIADQAAQRSMRSLPARERPDRIDALLMGGALYEELQRAESQRHRRGLTPEQERAAVRRARELRELWATWQDIGEAHNALNSSRESRDQVPSSLTVQALCGRYRAQILAPVEREASARTSRERRLAAEQQDWQSLYLEATSFIRSQPPGFLSPTPLRPDQVARRSRGLQGRADAADSGRVPVEMNGEEFMIRYEAANAVLAGELRNCIEPRLDQACSGTGSAMPQSSGSSDGSDRASR